jgi:hypothetical protein
MDQETILPKRLIAYIHDVGVRALDHLADTADGHVAVQPLVEHWRALTESDKQQFVDKVAASVVEAIAASALLPAGLKYGKKAVKSARKVLKKRTKALRKSVKALSKNGGKKMKQKAKRKKVAVAV